MSEHNGDSLIVAVHFSWVATVTALIVAGVAFRWMSETSWAWAAFSAVHALACVAHVLLSTHDSLVKHAATTLPDARDRIRVAFCAAGVFTANLPRPLVWKIAIGAGALSSSLVEAIILTLRLGETFPLRLVCAYFLDRAAPWVCGACTSAALMQRLSFAALVEVSWYGFPLATVLQTAATLSTSSADVVRQAERWPHVRDFVRVACLAAGIFTALAPKPLRWKNSAAAWAVGGALVVSLALACRLGVTVPHLAFVAGYCADHSLPFVLGFGGCLAVSRHAAYFALLRMRLCEAQRRVHELEEARRDALEERFLRAHRQEHGYALEPDTSCSESVTESGEDDDASGSHHPSHYTAKCSQCSRYTAKAPPSARQYFTSESDGARGE
jgi:hypothetical protein